MLQMGTVQVYGNFYRQIGDPTDCLTNLNIDVQPGELIAVVGQVGSGKSTMFHPILGELYPRRKSLVRVGGQIGYISQSAWIQNATVRDNIIMNQSYEQEKY
jgi:ABC-type bacteriocin/lantibiotic exporter with double-glycine peptidase domain